MRKSIYHGYEDYFKDIKGLNLDELNRTLKVTVNINKDDPGIKKRGFLSSPDTDKPPIIDRQNIIIEGLNFVNKDLLIIKGIEYYLLAMYAQWKSQDTHRKYSDLVGYIGNTYQISQNKSTLVIEPEIINRSLRNTLLANLFIHLEDEISSNFNVNEANKWWTFLQKTKQYGSQILLDIDRTNYLNPTVKPTFQFVNSIYKVNLPL